MRTFIIKTVNLVLIGFILFGFQHYAAGREKERAHFEAESEQADLAWKEANAALSQEMESGYIDGTYEGRGTGFGGTITVQIEIRKGAVAEAEILSAENETPDYLESARKILEEVVKKQSSDVDTVSGATLSSNGILEGVEKALEQAGKGDEE